jgi:hypothetical protein
MGQTFEVDPPFRVINSFSLFLGPRRNGSGPVSFRAYLGEWESFRLGEVVFESPTLTRNPPPSEEFSFTPTEYHFDVGGIRLKPNKEYVAFLSISELPLQPTSGFGMPSQGFDGLESGEFVFQNNGNDFELLQSSAWSTLGAESGLPPGTDVWFRASFSRVPEPSSLSLTLAAFLILVASRVCGSRPRAGKLCPLKREFSCSGTSGARGRLLDAPILRDDVPGGWLKRSSSEFGIPNGKRTGTRVRRP